MPPGTGDVQITLSQQVAIACSVIVTTPQKLSFIDVKKGMAMFEDLKIPNAAVVQNMSYFDCIHGHRHYPFGKGEDMETLKKEYHIPNSISFPILQALSNVGLPLVLHPECPVDIYQTYQELSTVVS